MAKAKLPADRAPYLKHLELAVTGDEVSHMAGKLQVDPSEDFKHDVTGLIQIGVSFLCWPSIRPDASVLDKLAKDPIKNRDLLKTDEVTDRWLNRNLWQPYSKRTLADFHDLLTVAFEFQSGVRAILATQKSVDRRTDPGKARATFMRRLFFIARTFNKNTSCPQKDRPDDLSKPLFEFAKAALAIVVARAKLTAAEYQAGKYKVQNLEARLAEWDLSRRKEAAAHGALYEWLAAARKSTGANL